MKKFKYNGLRKNKIGYIKEFSNEKLTPEKLERLKQKGWEEIKEVKKPKPKAKKGDK